MSHRWQGKKNANTHACKHARTQTHTQSWTKIGRFSIPTVSPSKKKKCRWTHVTVFNAPTWRRTNTVLHKSSLFGSSCICEDWSVPTASSTSLCSKLLSKAAIWLNHVKLVSIFQINALKDTVFPFINLAFTEDLLVPMRYWAVWERHLFFIDFTWNINLAADVVAVCLWSGVHLNSLVEFYFLMWSRHCFIRSNFFLIRTYTR